MLEGCAGGGACRLSSFQCGGLSVVVGVRVGGGLLLPMALVVHGSMVGASLWWAGCHCPWGDHCLCVLVGGVGGGARRPWWLSVGLQHGGGRCSLA